MSRVQPKATPPAFVSERVLDRAAQDWNVGDWDLRQRKLTDAGASVAQESEELVGQAPAELRVSSCGVPINASPEMLQDLHGDTKRSEVNARGNGASKGIWSERC